MERKAVPARSGTPLASHRPRIGILCKHSWDEEAGSDFFTLMRENVEQQIRALDMTVGRLFRPGEPLGHGDTLDLDGLIAIGAIDSRPVLAVCEGYHNIVFLKNTVAREHDIDVVQNDMAGATREGLSLLAALGHRAIGLMVGPISDLDVITQRQSSSLDVRHHTYLEWMRVAGLLDPRRVQVTSWSEAGGYQAARAVLRGRRLPTAFLIASDALAAGALRAFTEAGLRVPEDLSILSFDNTARAAEATPPLSSFELDPGEAGRQAVNVLFDRINGRRTPVHVTIPAHLVVRKSCTIPRERGD